MKVKDKTSWILYMGTFPPRECGIATFTRDLTRAIDKKFAPSIKSKILAMNNDVTNIYNYSEDVLYQINDPDIQEYMDVAKKINQNDMIKLVNIQHEFGIFGGQYGSYLIPFLEILKKPVVVTFHTVLPNPDERLKKVVKSISDQSECLIVMSPKAIDILRNDYGVSKDIVIIPHGIPHVEYSSSSKSKLKMGFDDQIILSSFGMMNSGKGYEYVIEALPSVVEKYPHILYLIVGETHPVVRKKFGEGYRTMLEDKVKRLGLQRNVKFYNKYLKLNEIIKYLEATDIYVSSNMGPNQIVSGTLSYAMGCGRAVISTPYIYAQDFVNSKRGLLVEFKKPESFSEAILKLLDDESLRNELSKNSYNFTRHMTWSNVALSYDKVFKKYISQYKRLHKELPPIKLKHLSTISNKFGVIQFSNHTDPDISSGYTLDDNARAMIVCAMHYDNFKDSTKLKSIETYLNFIEFVQHEDGKLYNIVDGECNLDLEDWSEDAHGRGLWALGHLMSRERIPQNLKDQAKKIFDKGLSSLISVKSVRGAAFILLGLYYYCREFPSEDKVVRIRELADYLKTMFDANSTDDWHWFEKSMTYSNSKLPEAMLCAFLVTEDEKYLEIATESLNFLISITYENGSFAPIGQNGWYVSGENRAYFDQQPVDTASMVQTMVLAYKVFKNKYYLDKAEVAFQWFLGNNFLNQMIYDERSGGCHDGIGEFSINLNQGAESTISYLLARLILEKNKKIVVDKGRK
tara:strand:- start:11289 stop:13520 length:2232 start_codon:yes stop_codon:yes gene_type:complete